MVKLRFSEKATKNWWNLTLSFNISFVTFSEYTYELYSTTIGNKIVIQNQNLNYMTIDRYFLTAQYFSTQLSRLLCCHEPISITSSSNDFQIGSEKCDMPGNKIWRLHLLHTYLLTYLLLISRWVMIQRVRFVRSRPKTKRLHTYLISFLYALYIDWCTYVA